MEIRLRPLGAALVMAALAGVLGYLAWPRLAPLTTRLTHPHPATTPTAPAVPVPAGGPTITYLDESLGWDWDVSCEAEFHRFLAERLAGKPIAAVQITLVDQTPDSQFPFGTTYRAAQANGNCYNQAGRFTCQVAVTAGEPGPDLDVAVTLNSPYTLLDMFLARGPNPNEIRQTWNMATFQPLLVPAEEANRWQSSCLRISRAR